MKNEKQCAGTYPVSGYIRNDGTEVSGYMRTCGAKHTGNTEALQGGVSMDVPLDEIEDKSNLYAIEDILSALQEWLEKNIPFWTVHHKYYRLALDFDKQKQFNKNNSYIKFKDIKDDNVKLILQNVCGMNNIKNTTDIVVVQYDSKLMKMVCNSQEFQNFLLKNIDAIKRGEYENKYFELNFNNTRDLRLTLGKSVLYNPKYRNGIFTTSIIDVYDFAHMQYNLLHQLQEIKNVKDVFPIVKSIVNVTVNNNAYAQQRKGRLRNYALIIPVILFEYNGLTMPDKD